MALTVLEINLSLSRRTFLRQSIGSLAGASVPVLGKQTSHPVLPEETRLARQVDDLSRYDFLFTRIKFMPERRNYHPYWNIEPCAEGHLLQELSKVLRCKTKPVLNARRHQPLFGEPDQFNAFVELQDAAYVRQFPFLFMTEEHPFQFTAQEEQVFKDYIQSGGFVMIDDCVLSRGGNFCYMSGYTLLEKLFGPGAVKVIPPEHEIFHNVFDTSDVGLPHIQGHNHGPRGVFMGERLAVFLSSTDVHCGWIDRDNVLWRRNRASGKHGYREAIELGINLIAYVMTH